jgi:hypothetical protein
MADTLITAYVDGYGQASNNNQIFGNSTGQYSYGDQSNFLVSLLEKAPNGIKYYDLSAATFSVAFGRPYLTPNRGAWRIGTGSVSGSDLQYNATTTDLKNSVSLLYGNVTVTTYGSTTNYGYIITAATINTALTISGESLSLSPDSYVETLNLTTHSTSVTAQKIVRMRRKPYISKQKYVTTNVIPPAVTLYTSTSSQIVGLFSFDSGLTGFTTYHLFKFNVSGAITYSWEFSVAAYTDFVPGAPYPSPARASGPSNVVRQFTLQREGIPTNGGAATEPYAYVTKDITSRTQYPPIQRAFFYKTGKQTTSAGGLLSSVTGSGGFYDGYVDDVAIIRLYGQSPIREDNTLNFDFQTIVTGTSVTLTVTTQGTAGGYFNLGVVTFSSSSLDEAFVENKSNVVALTLELQAEYGGKKNTIASIPTTISRTII